ncbi:speckle-type POZ protein-like [Leptopilina heterotoma]|uniref:speckle-type POZ protein-like n=1 Tax=Leptopilina heterotoma TaxID=63436 RepID=UPI001CA95FAF|nr:speckle-type POZ protein-like [Leptopilina heterotoma]
MATSQGFISLSGEITHTESYCTSLDVHKYEYKWTITDFEFVCRKVKVIRSQKFTTKNFRDGNFIIVLEPAELVENNKDPFHIHLYYDTKLVKDKKLLNVKISFERFDTYPSYALCVKSFSTDNLYRCEKRISWKTNGSNVYRSFVEKRPKNTSGNYTTPKVIPTDITVKCEVSIIYPGAILLKTPLIDIQCCNGIVKKIENLLDNEDFKDVTFNVEDEKFTAHKNILAIRSSVFAAMFMNKMSEKQTSVVEIDDIKPVIFQQMLNYIYTDKVENLDDAAFEFLYVAEKYQLENLRIMCINSLNYKISLTTVLKTLEIAELYSIEQLRYECLKFIIENKYEIVETDDFQKLILNRPSLWTEVINLKESGGGKCSKYSSYELK